LIFKEREVMGRALYHYYRAALFVIVICALVFPAVLQYQLIASQCMPLFVLSFFVVNLVAGTIFITGLLKARCKWAALLIALIFASVLLGILTRWAAKHG